MNEIVEIINQLHNWNFVIEIDSIRKNCITKLLLVQEVFEDVDVSYLEHEGFLEDSHYGMIELLDLLNYLTIKKRSKKWDKS